MSFLHDFYHLFYPEICLGCGRALFTNEECICTSCRYHLPQTGYHLYPSNAVMKNFWGKVPVSSAAAYLFFNKGEKVQKILHQLKYRGRHDVGNFLGRLYGVELKKSPLFDTVEVVVPIPLHPKRKLKRGYNQAEVFANGLAEAMSVQVNTISLLRAKHTQTQTKKNRYSRWLNVEEIFELSKTESLINKHILLVDDVVTTGATLESAVSTLLKIPGIKVSIACIASA